MDDWNGIVLTHLKEQEHTVPVSQCFARAFLAKQNKQTTHSRRALTLFFTSLS